MLNLLKKIFDAETDPQAIQVKEAIELIVDESFPQIRHIRGYRKKLKQPVETALKHCAELAGQIPGTVDLSNKDQTNTTLVRGFFNDAEQAKAIVSESLELKNFLEKEQCPELYLLLTMQRYEKTVFGAKLEGNIIMRDVATKAFLFKDHQIILPSKTLDEMYSAIQLRLLKVLAHNALEFVLSEQSRELELKKIRDELDIKLKIMRKERKEMALNWSDSERRETFTESQKLLDQIENELKAISAETIDGDFYLNQLGNILNNPDQHLSLELIPMVIDRIGTFVRDQASETDAGVQLAEFKSGPDKSRSVVLIKCHRDLLNQARS